MATRDHPEERKTEADHRTARREKPADPTTRASGGILGLQSSAGNAAVTRLLDTRAADRNRAPAALQRLPQRGPVVQRRPLAVQRDITGTHKLKLGEFELGMIAKNDALTGAGPSGLRGTIKFKPDPKGPYSTKVGLVQIVKLQDDKGTNVNPVSLPTTTGPKIRTKEDKKGGVQGGFYTDVLHQDPFTTPGKTQVPAPGSAVSPYYAFSSSGAQKFGFRRSTKEADIGQAELFDFPGTTSKTAKFDFSFETVAKGDDNLVTYGTAKWSFGLRGGKVVNEASSVTEGSSATFAEAMEKHRAFYVHEPVAFYFGFGSGRLAADEAAKIDTFLDYVVNNADVRIKVEGFADTKGNAEYNLRLSEKRAKHVAEQLTKRGISDTRIDAPTAKGSTTTFSADAKTAQTKEANRHANRRVVVTFYHGPPPKKGP